MLFVEKVNLNNKSIPLTCMYIDMISDTKAHVKKSKLVCKTKWIFFRLYLALETIGEINILHIFNN